MIRLTLLYFVISVLSFSAFRDWYKSLCGLIVLMAVMEHPDMPNTIGGIQGLNPWNLLLVFVVMGWMASRQAESLTWDMPRHITILLFLYLSVIIAGFFRMLLDQQGLIEYDLLRGSYVQSTMGLISNTLINTLKFAIPGLLLFVGCRSRSRFFWGISSLLAIYFLLSLQTIKYMHLGSILHGSLSERSVRILDKEVGYHRVDLSAMLAGASWAIIVTLTLAKKKFHSLLIIFSTITVFLGQLLTGGRAGYVAWLAVGSFIAFFRWRKYLLLIPVIILVVWSIPGVSNRISQGFSESSTDDSNMETFYSDNDSKHDWYSITSGRVIAWPYVIEKIAQAPFLGYGRYAMQRTGISSQLWIELRESFPHPHNAYLQLLLDNGLIGFIPVIIFYFIIIKYSISLLCDSRSPVFITIGGITFSLVFAMLVASLGSQTFYPREGTVGMWCAIGLMFRVYIERSRLITAGKNLSFKDIDQLLWKE